MMKNNGKLEKKTTDLIKFFKIIGDDNRLRILLLLKSGECCVCEIWPYLRLSQNLTSSHLKIMHDFKILNKRRVGKKNYYSLNQPVFKKYTSLLINILKNKEN